MLEVIGITNCNTIKKTKDWLQNNEISYSFRDVKKDPLTPNELAGLVKKAGLDTLVNRQGRKWKMLGLSDKQLSDNDLFDVLLEHQTMIKRPVLRKGEAVLVGFDQDAIASFLGEDF
ncbi:arsenate reductase family protein [Natronogracilivirga saccharolytica]|uniref:Arsenate reductase family protein n=1 Tax=Natronogracilivirga saccharolytica TaxID=2812953 RepID=A0A8J7S973_9BACT|nr:arsenate reductase family protein [Natronogracilivirga saccharolytica]MBP3192653.1 arsenate reductase family protein [Natronogracilivirga saccharolytica]